MTDSVFLEGPILSLQRHRGIELRMGKRFRQALACLFLLTFGVGVWVVFARPFESPRDKALRLCGECGLDVDEIDWLIDTMRHSTLTRAENLSLFRAQYEREADADFCEDCAVAVMDAAERSCGCP